MTFDIHHIQQIPILLSHKISTKSLKLNALPKHPILRMMMLFNHKLGCIYSDLTCRFEFGMECRVTKSVVRFSILQMVCRRGSTGYSGAEGGNHVGKDHNQEFELTAA